MKLGFVLSQVFIMVMAAFSLGQKSIEFSGSTTAWMVVIFSALVLIASPIALITHLRSHA